MGRKRKGSAKESSNDQHSVTPTIGEDTSSPEEASQEKFQKRFPHLAAEIEGTSSLVRIDGVRWEKTDRSQVTSTSGRAEFSGFSPDVIDFLRRCNNEQEALEIIDFLEKRCEIDAAYAKALRQQLRVHGLRSFGAKKSWGYYEREG
jgi:hypothetical protein